MCKCFPSMKLKLVRVAAFNCPKSQSELQLVAKNMADEQVRMKYLRCLFITVGLVHTPKDCLNKSSTHWGIQGNQLVCKQSESDRPLQFDYWELKRDTTEWRNQGDTVQNDKREKECSVWTWTHKGKSHTGRTGEKKIETFGPWSDQKS